MQVVRSRAEVRRARAALPSPVGLVPTMGALHAGHASLLARARRECAAVVASLFVNPTQFGPHEDFARYPRDEAADLERFEAEGVDVVFVPPVEEVYPPGASTSVEVGRLGEVLEGAARPGHFRGVATVVTVLLMLTAPQRAYFGQKDGQQTVVVRRLVRDLGLPVEVIVGATVRDADGLALSSRNAYLSPEERRAAPVLYRALEAAREAHAAGERDGEQLRQLMRATVTAEPLARLDYASAADLESLEELAVLDRPALLSLAVRFPSARLIDCLVLS
ncbi:MAG TPA: pantoate--beta-alanine ligase [Candidatus Limnocylindrales bacterium]|nr:pantoate--beta-alanine ligase [Candidatus Limnocylindrales bacterium]